MNDEPAPTRLPDPKPITSDLVQKKKSKLSKKQRLLLFSGVGAVVIAAAVATWLVPADNKQPDNTTTHNQSSTVKSDTQPRLGVAVTVIDGDITYQKAADVQTAPNAGDAPWHPVDTNTELKEGDQVRTGNGSRAVLTFDDGSAIRLDANSMITLTSLIAKDVTITQVSGTVYSRVVASDRKYSVIVSDTTYQALGAAFITIKRAGEHGVQVYQSSVQGGGHTMTEGKQFYSMNNNKDLEGKVTDIDIDTLVDNEFIAWNTAEDEKDATFKEKLGILPTIKQRGNEKKEEAAEKERKATEEKKKQQEKAKVTRGTMSLSLSGEQFTWSYTGKAVHGYKLVFSNTNPNPTFEGPATQSIYFNGFNHFTGTIPGPEKTGPGTFYITVCAYTNGTEAEPCVDYSPVVRLDR